MGDGVFVKLFRVIGKGKIRDWWENWIRMFDWWIRFRKIVLFLKYSVWNILVIFCCVVFSVKIDDRWY